MQIKSKFIFIFSLIINFLMIYANLHAEELNITAREIEIDKANNIIIGKGNVEVTDEEGKVIKSDKSTYEKSREFLTSEGSVAIYDIEGNVLKTNKATYDKLEEIIVTYNNSQIILNNGYKLASNKIFYDITNKIMSSNQDSIFTDLDGNTVMVNMFQYQIKNNLLSSVGNIKIVDTNENKYFLKELYVDTKNKEMVGSDVDVILDQENFGLSKENDPRFSANDILISENISTLSKGIFTVCKQKKDSCPPWVLQAKKITHDKTKKTIYYENAVLKIYDIPIFYFPRFFHPDPTVKRSSGFLSPFFTDSTAIGTGIGLPYYWAISDSKDLTFTPKTYAKENILFLNEYRQAFENGFLTLDTSYTQGYKNTSKTKTDGSRNHIFANLDLNLAKNQSYDSNLNFKMQRTSNDTYFRIHDINTDLVQAENTNLENKISYNFSKDNEYLDISAAVYEDLRKNTNARYEYILPNILYGKTFFTQEFGSVDFKSNTFYKNYDANKSTTFLTNDIIWNSNNTITKKGFVNSFEGIIQNTNYEAKNTADYKTGSIINELSSVLSFKSSLPMKKEKGIYSNFFSPNFMVRYAPAHMKDLRGDDVNLNYSNLFSTNKTSVIEDGLNAILGFDFKINENKKDKEKFSIAMGQVFSPKVNSDLPSRSSLDQKMSDVVGEVNYNFSQIGSINYKFSLDHNFNDLNYNLVSTNLNFGRVEFNLDYLEEQNHVGDEHYIKTGFNLNLNNNNSLSFGTKKNFKTSSTEFYDLKYQYAIDCLKAGLVFRREYYNDSDVEPKDSLMFVLTFVPFTGVSAPLINQ